MQHDDNDDDAIDRFAAEAEAFERWATTPTPPPTAGAAPAAAEPSSVAAAVTAVAAARAALVRLARLYAAALALPLDPPTPPVADEEAGATETADVGEAEWRAVFERCAWLPFEAYAKVMDPLPVPPEQPVVASLADDVADVYADVVGGLRRYRAGRRDDALFQWRLDFETHWGEHATAAIRALHGWLAANDPRRLAGG